MKKLISIRIPVSLCDTLEQERIHKNTTLTDIIIDTLNTNLRDKEYYQQTEEIKSTLEQLKKQMYDQVQLQKYHNETFESQIITIEKELSNLNKLVGQLVNYNDDHKKGQGMANWVKRLVK